MEASEFQPLSNEHIKEYARITHDAGFSTVPVNKRKAPWRQGWQNECELSRVAPVASDYTSDRLDGVGILTGTQVVRDDKLVPKRFFNALDIDIYDEDTSLAMAEVVASVLGFDDKADMMVRFGQQPKWLLPFFTTNQIRKINSTVYRGNGAEHRVEVLAKGQQFVAFGNHWGAQTHYLWLGAEAPDNPFDPWFHPKHFPVITDAQLTEIIAGFDRVCSESGFEAVGSPVTPIFGSEMPDDDLDWMDRDNHKADLSTKEIVKVLQQYPAQGLGSDYDGWADVGMALNHQFDGGDEGYDLWWQWSKASKYHLNGAGDKSVNSESQMRRKYKSFTAEGKDDRDLRTFKTIIYRKDQFLKTPAGKKHIEKLAAKKAKKKAKQFKSQFQRVGPGTFAKPIFKDWMLKGVIARQSFGCIYGPPKTGKSFVTLDLCCHLAHGMDWCGIRVAAPMNVLYIAGEGHDGIIERIAAWRLHHNIPDEEYTNVYVSKTNVMMADPEQFADIEVELEMYREMGAEIGLMVVDTYSRTIGGYIDENSNSDTAEFIEKLQGLTVTHNIAEILVHHTPKNQSQVLRGAGALHGALDWSISVGQQERGKLLVTSQDQKDGAGFDPLHFSLISMDLPLEYFVDNFGEAVNSAYLYHDVSGFTQDGSVYVPKDITSGRAVEVWMAYEEVWAASDGREQVSEEAFKAHEMSIERLGLKMDVVFERFLSITSYDDVAKAQTAFRAGRRWLAEKNWMKLHDDVMMKTLRANAGL